jgi:hypothetical protein
MRKLLFLILALISFGISKAQTDSSLVLKKVGLSRTVEIEMDDMVKIKTADGEYYKGRFVKRNDEQLILTYDTIAIDDIVKVMANTKVRRRQSSVLLASGLVAFGAGALMHYGAGQLSNEMEEGSNWPIIFVALVAYGYSAHAIFFGVINYNGYNSYQVAGRRANWEIAN